MLIYLDISKTISITRCCVCRQQTCWIEQRNLSNFQQTQICLTPVSRVTRNYSVTWKISTELVCVWHSFRASVQRLIELNLQTLWVSTWGYVSFRWPLPKSDCLVCGNINHLRATSHPSDESSLRYFLFVNFKRGIRDSTSEPFEEYDY